MLGRGGSDRLYGYAGNDVLDSGAGNDNLDGYAGNDVYVFGKGYGNDTINASDTTADKRDVVRLVGLTADDVEIVTVQNPNSYHYHHLVIRIKETGETLTIQNVIYSDGAYKNSYSIEAIEFGDGSVLEWADWVKSGVLMLGSEGNDSLTASRLDTTMEGLGGDDYLYGNSGHDKIFGGDGADRLYGYAGNDVLDSGANADHMDAGVGDDTYLFSRGDGQDTISNNGNGNDTLSFTDVNPAELWFGKSGNHLTIGLVGTSDQVTVNNWFSGALGNYSIDSIEAGELAITENQVALMIQAMASVGAPGGADGQWTDEQREALAPVLASYWQPKI